MRSTKFLTIRVLLAGVLMLIGGSQARAWDTQPDENGKYDGGLFDRPTHFPEWHQPVETWPNTMYYRCVVRLGDVTGPALSNYEIAVYDQDDELRHCNRSRIEDGDVCVLTIRGEEGDKFHFQVVYGDDFSNPIIVDVPETTANFKTNDIVGDTEPFVLVLPGRTYLSEHDTQLPASKEGTDVTVMRTIRGGEWSTICLPFAIPEEEMENVFGEGVELADFKGYETEEENDEIVGISVKFQDVKAIEANHPYIIRVASDLSELNIDGVDVDAEDEPVNAAVNRTRKQWSEMIGNYVDGFTVPEQCLFISGGKFYYSVGKTKMMAYRAYFDFYDLLPSVDDAGARITVKVGDEEMTAVPAVERAATPSQQAGQYDLLGRRVQQPARGIVIEQGRKTLKP